MEYLDKIFFAFWFFLPAGLANMFPIFAAHLPGLKKLDYPMDFNFSFHGRRIFGSHKTIRGLVVGILTGIVTAFFLHQPVMLGFLLGLGAILGDAVKSFFKRGMKLEDGQSWFFFDQIDYILGGIAFSFWNMPLALEQYLYIFVVYFSLHLLTSAFGYFLGLKQNPI